MPAENYSKQNIQNTCMHCNYVCIVGLSMFLYSNDTINIMTVTNYTVTLVDDKIYISYIVQTISNSILHSH